MESIAADDRRGVGERRWTAAAPESCPTGNATGPRNSLKEEPWVVHIARNVVGRRPLSEADLPAAMIHGSVFPEDLVISEDGSVWLTDFDRCHRAPLVLETATASGELGARAIQGYQDVRPLTDAERELLPAAVTRVTIHLGLARGDSVERIAQRLA